MYNDVHVFDVRNETMRKVKTSGTAPSHRGCHSATKYGSNEIVVFGGASCQNGPYVYFNDLHVYNRSTKSWKKCETKGTPPSPRAQHSAVMFYDHNLIIVGGFDGKNVLNDVIGLHMPSLTWREWITHGRSPAVPKNIAQKNFRVFPCKCVVGCVNFERDHSGKQFLIYFGFGCYLLDTQNWTWSKVDIGEVNEVAGLDGDFLGSTLVCFGGIDQKKIVALL